MKNKSKVTEMVMIAIFTALIAVGAFIKIPVPVLPFTLQFLFTTLAGLVLGGKLGALSVLLYIIFGLLGLPIFTEGGGFWYIFRPSFGYIIGFCLASYVTGKLVEKYKKQGFKEILCASFIGLGIVYGMGLIYYYIIANYVIHTPIGVWALFLYCFLFAVPGDICLCFLATYLTKRLKSILVNI